MWKLVGIVGSLALCNAASALELGTNEERMSFKKCLTVIQKTARDAGTAPVRYGRHAGNANGPVSSR